MHVKPFVLIDEEDESQIIMTFATSHVEVIEDSDNPKNVKIVITPSADEEGNQVLVGSEKEVSYGLTKPWWT